MKEKLVILFIVFLMGCANVDVSNLSEKDIQKIAGSLSDEDVDKLIACDSPYMRFGTGCCLDVDDNNICDDDEEAKKNVEEETTTTTLITQMTIETLDGRNGGKYLNPAPNKSARKW